MDNEDIALVLYFLKRKLYQTAQSLCEASLSRKADPVLSFWKAASFFFMEKYNDAIRDLTLLLQLPDLQLLVPIALIQTYRNSPSKFPDALQEMEARLSLSQTFEIPPKILFMIVFFLLLIDEFNEALQWASKIPKETQWNQYAYGWIDVMDSNTSFDNIKAITYDPDAMSFLIQLLILKERQKRHEMLQPLLTQFSFIPLHIEYIHCLFELGSYIEIKSFASKLQAQSRAYFDVVLAFFLASFFLNDEDGKKNLDQLISTLHRTEYSNPSLISMLLQLFLNLPYDPSAIVCLTHVSPILQQLGKRLIELSPHSHRNHIKLGFVYYRLNFSELAINSFKKAIEMDPESISALEGQLLTQMTSPHFLEYTKDLELLESINGSTSPLTYYLCYLHHWNHTHQTDQAFFYLKELVQKIFDQIAASSGLWYFSAIDVQLLKLSADALINLCPANPVMLSCDSMHVLTELSDYFQHMYPGSADSLFLKGLTKYLHHQAASYVEEFQNVINSKFLHHFPCALMLTEMYIQLQKYQEAQATLDGALASNLEANRNGFFISLKFKLNRLSQSGTTILLENIDTNSLNQRQKVIYFVELAWSQASAQNSEEVLRQAQNHVFGIHRVELELALAEIHMHYHNYDRALNLFNAIQNPCFQIHQRIADWYFQRRDFKMYLETCKKWVDEQGTKVAYMGLAQAYLVLEDVDRAIDTLNLALCCYPQDSTLILEIAQILTLHHAYSRAIDYLQQGDAPECRVALAQLHFKMHQDDQVLEVLVHSNSNPLTYEMHAVLAKLYLRQGQHQKASEHLQKAMDGFKQPLDLAEMYHQLYVIHEDIEYLHRSNAAYPTKKVLLLLAQHAIDHRLWNQADSCIQDLHKIGSQQDLDSKYLQIDLWVQRRFFDKAIQLQQEILQQSPLDFKALSGYISLAYRMGKVEDVDKKLNEVNDVEHAGAYYCKGLRFKYRNEVYEAVREFRKCQSDSEWQSLAWQQILEFLIFPNISELHTPLELDTLEKANLLLQELPEGEVKTFWKICYLCGLKKKNDLEQALLMAQSLPTNSILSLLSCSFIHIMLKNEGKAKNFLKRLAKEEWRYKEALFLETGWLLLADLYLQQNKYEPADALVKSSLDSNKMCAKAWELYARVTESKDITGSIDYWTRAWKVHSYSDLTVAWKLAKALLKAQRYTEAIDVCHHVIKREPESEIRSEVLDKSRQQLLSGFISHMPSFFHLPKPSFFDSFAIEPANIKRFYFLI